MSGIAGILRFDGAPIEPGLIEKMTSAMAYRGPDGIHHWVKGSVALGHCMLRTTPESLEEQQPLANEDASLVMVMDGRVDNWEELRRELLGRGAMLRDRSDAELVLRAYEVWGRDYLSHIDGDFALVIWDARRRSAFCARDRLGNKPFTYYWDGKTLIFASELHTILALPGVPHSLNEGMVAEFLAAEWYSLDETFWLGIMRLQAGHQMEADGSSPRLARYWVPDLGAELPCGNDEEYTEYYRELLADIVRRQSRTHLPLACEVSGGLDSSAIFAMAEYLRRQQQLVAPSLDGYTLDFHDDPDANELDYARAVGAHLGCTIHEITPSKMPLSWYREWGKRYREFPGYPNGAMHYGINLSARARGSRVLLSGVGGDEWLGGSRSYYVDALAARQWRELYRAWKMDFDAVGLTSLGWLCRHGLAPLLPAPVKATLRRIVPRDREEAFDLQAWLTPSLGQMLRERREIAQRVPEPAGRIGQRGDLAKLADAYPVFVRELNNRFGESLGLEYRSPYWTAAMVQFALAAPGRLRRQGKLNKALHRQAMQGLLPETVLQRETKAEFSVTYRWHLRDMRDDFMGRLATRRYGWVQSPGVDMTYRASDQANHASGWPERMLWGLYGSDALAD